MEPSVVRRTQETLGKVIKKPQLSDKYLNKPPFRFLHDIFTEVIRSTGFMKGLYSESDLKSDNIKDRESKMLFLQKAIDTVELLTGEVLWVRPARVVAGQEPEKTNELLQAIALCCLKKRSSDDAVRRVLSGEKLTSASSSSSRPPEREREEEHCGGEAKSKSKDSHKNGGSDPRRGQREGEDERRGERRGEKDAREEKRKDERRGEKEREKREDKERREEKKGEGREKKEERERRERRGEKEKTRSNDREREKERETHKKEERERERDKHRDKEREREKQKDREKERDREEREKERERDREKDREREREKDRERDREKDREKEKEREKERRRRERDPDRTRSKPREEEPQTQTTEEPQDPTPEEPRPPAESSARIPRPSSAKGQRRKAPVGSQDESDSDGDADVKVPEPTSDQPSEPAPSRRTVRPSSARPAPPRVKKQESHTESPSERSSARVSSVILDQRRPEDEEDEDEQFLVHEAETVEPAAGAIEAGGDVSAHGGLVKKILETKKYYEVSPSATKPQSPVRTQQDLVEREMVRLQSSVQSVCRSALPLGKIMDYLQEDVDAMSTELSHWRHESQEHARALKDQHRLTEELLQPLRTQLSELDSLIVERQTQICALRCSVLKNEEKIHKMLTGLHT